MTNTDEPTKAIPLGRMEAGASATGLKSTVVCEVDLIGFGTQESRDAAAKNFLPLFMRLSTLSTLAVRAAAVALSRKELDQANAVIDTVNAGLTDLTEFIRAMAQRVEHGLPAIPKVAAAAQAPNGRMRILPP